MLGVEVDARSRNPLFEHLAAGALKGLGIGIAAAHRPARGHAEGLLIEGTVGILVQVTWGLEGAGEPRANHDIGSSRGQCEGDIARVAHAAVGPNMGANLAGGRSALQDGRELRAAHASLHAGGAHRARAHTDLDNVRAGRGQLAHAFGRHDIACGNGKPQVQSLDFAQCPEHAVLVPVRGIDDQHISTGLRQGAGAAFHIAVNTHRSTNVQAALLVDARPIHLRPHRTLPREDAGQGAVWIHHRRQLAGGLAQFGKGLLRVYAHRQRDQVGGHQLADGGEVILSAQVLRRDDADRHVSLDHDGGTMGALVQKVAGIAHGVVRLNGNWGVIDQIRRLHRGDGFCGCF